VTRYIAAYDVEQPACLTACRTIVEVHRRYAMPATFFVTGQVLEADGHAYHELFSDSLFEVSSHTFSHKLLRDHPLCGPAAPLDEIREDLARGKAAVESLFDGPCVGLRTPVAFEQGLRGAPEVLALVREVGFRYVSSQAWGLDCSLPAPLNQPFAYAGDGFAELWGLPAHGWHENLLKDHNRWGPRRLTLWPPAMPEATPPGFLQTPAEEFAVHRVFLDKALADRLTFVSLIWHPWSLGKFDPPMRMLEMVFDRVRESGLQPCTYAGLFEEMARKARRHEGT
jgi:peptidoglycan/xylan/chitin deacetylase (PgdA/CDA1 family)